ncbi:MAG: hypothetical protein KME44_07995 [Candidatus Thiodiazotropha sp. (ex Lucina pensylvanica)]|nr:hypothetical protein [Candidatus Thiodiazotropha sp. (ex Lucina pensylvanica)]
MKNFIKYSYEIGDDKYQARIDIYKYLVGLEIALIAASLFGLEKVAILLDHNQMDAETVHHLKIAITALILSTIQGTLVLVLSYHHKHYNAKFLEKNRVRFENMDSGIGKTIYGYWLYMEHLGAFISTYAVQILAGTWLILPLIALIYLAKIYSHMLS